MSRHVIPAINPTHEVVVGWDKGMSTFFGTVTDPDLERRASDAGDRVAEAVAAGRTPDPEDEKLSMTETILLWVGASRVGEVQTVEELAGELAEYAEIPDEVREQLRRDRGQAGPPSAAQRAGQVFIEGARRA